MRRDAADSSPAVLSGADRSMERRLAVQLPKERSRRSYTYPKAGVCHPSPLSRAGEFTDTYPFRGYAKIYGVKYICMKRAHLRGLRHGPAKGSHWHVVQRQFTFFDKHDDGGLRNTRKFLRSFVRSGSAELCFRSF